MGVVARPQAGHMSYLPQIPIALDRAYQSNGAMVTKGHTGMVHTKHKKVLS